MSNSSSIDDQYYSDDTYTSDPSNYSNDSGRPGATYYSNETNISEFPKYSNGTDNNKTTNYRNGTPTSDDQYEGHANSTSGGHNSSEQVSTSRYPDYTDNQSLFIKNPVSTRNTLIVFTMLTVLVLCLMVEVIIHIRNKSNIIQESK
ncbi:hypothetical protein RF11_10699 [Thelohanellus kitauei]|uniref:Uncharacterized protein n=1 Tax=Thelohanellus kitauei TaxID=669202 RepID=A0A0C2MUQ4_THEKT|nr:hypothetical protein RF11_10699 [Thelohanellus kitauei]